MVAEQGTVGYNGTRGTMGHYQIRQLACEVVTANNVQRTSKKSTVPDSALNRLYSLLPWQLGGKIFVSEIKVKATKSISKKYFMEPEIVILSTILACKCVKGPFMLL